jgi:predicted O-methyltransferase YrrM
MGRDERLARKHRRRRGGALRAARSGPGARPPALARGRAAGDTGLTERGEAPATSRGISGARRILEIGTLGGYSTIHHDARASPEDGRLISLELDERHAEVARENIAEAGLAGMVEVRVRDARELLAAMADGLVEPFDLVFIDADKGGYPEYLEWTVSLSCPDSIVFTDDTIRGGAVLDPQDESARATREFNERLARDPRIDTIVDPDQGPRRRAGYRPGYRRLGTPRRSPEGARRR